MSRTSYLFHPLTQISSFRNLFIYLFIFCATAVVPESEVSRAHRANERVANMIPLTLSAGEQRLPLGVRSASEKKTELVKHENEEPAFNMGLMMCSHTDRRAGARSPAAGITELSHDLVTLRGSLWRHSSRRLRERLHLGPVVR